MMTVQAATAQTMQLPQQLLGAPWQAHRLYFRLPATKESSQMITGRERVEGGERERWRERERATESVCVCLVNTHTPVWALKTETSPQNTQPGSFHYRRPRSRQPAARRAVGSGCVTPTRMAVTLGPDARQRRGVERRPCFLVSRDRRVSGSSCGSGAAARQRCHSPLHEQRSLAGVAGVHAQRKRKMPQETRARPDAHMIHVFLTKTRRQACGGQGQGTPY